MIEFVDRIDNSVSWVTAWHHEALPSDASDPMPNSDERDRTV